MFLTANEARQVYSKCRKVATPPPHVQRRHVYRRRKRLMDNIMDEMGLAVTYYQEQGITTRVHPDDKDWVVPKLQQAGYAVTLEPGPLYMFWISFTQNKTDVDTSEQSKGARQ